MIGGLSCQYQTSLPQVEHHHSIDCSKGPLGQLSLYSPACFHAQARFLGGFLEPWSIDFSHPVSDYGSTNLVSSYTRISNLVTCQGMASICSWEGWITIQRASEYTGIPGIQGIGPSYHHLSHMGTSLNSRSKSEEAFWNLAAYEHNCIRSTRAFYWYMGRNLSCRNISWILQGS